MPEHLTVIFGGFELEEKNTVHSTFKYTLAVAYTYSPKMLSQM